MHSRTGFTPHPSTRPHRPGREHGCGEGAPRPKTMFWAIATSPGSHARHGQRTCTEPAVPFDFTADGGPDPAAVRRRPAAPGPVDRRREHGCGEGAPGYTDYSSVVLRVVACFWWRVYDVVQIVPRGTLWHRIHPPSIHTPTSTPRPGPKPAPVMRGTHLPIICRQTC